MNSLVNSRVRQLSLLIHLVSRQSICQHTKSSRHLLQSRRLHLSCRVHSLLKVGHGQYISVHTIKHNARKTKATLKVFLVINGRSAIETKVLAQNAPLPTSKLTKLVRRPPGKRPPPLCTGGTRDRAVKKKIMSPNGQQGRSGAGRGYAVPPGGAVGRGAPGVVGSACAGAAAATISAGWSRSAGGAGDRRQDCGGGRRRAAAARRRRVAAECRRGLRPAVVRR